VDRPPTNPWCETLGIPVPDVGSVLRSRSLGYLDVLVLALLARGRPTSIDDVLADVLRLVFDEPAGLRE
jgi:hypothetical protein